MTDNTEERKKPSRTKVILQCLFLALLIVGTFWIAKTNRDKTDAQRNLQPSTKVTQNGYLENSGVVFGTFYHIKYQNDKDLSPEIEAVMAKVDSSLSMFNQESVVSRINSNRSSNTDKFFREVFALSKTVHANTHGCFDPTVAPLVNAWGFGFKNGALPNAEQVDSLKALIGLDKVRMQDNQIEKDDAGIIMDFSAIAKGYGVDKVAELLREKGVKNYMVEIGGEVIVKGVNSKGTPWHVGIAKPTETEGRDANPDEAASVEYQEVLELTDKAMATSGNYRNFYYAEDGRKLAHTIDPHSGYPIQHSILSSTVFAPSCAEADAYATAFMVMGLDKAKEVLKQQQQLEVYLIYTDAQGKYQVYKTIK